MKRPKGPVKRPGPLVEVEWMDVYTALGWQDEADLEDLLTADLFPCITLGYLLIEADDRVVICSSANVESFQAEITVIPRGCVKRIHRLGAVRRLPHKSKKVAVNRAKRA